MQEVDLRGMCSLSRLSRLYTICRVLTREIGSCQGSGVAFIPAWGTCWQRISVRSMYAFHLEPLTLVQHVVLGVLGLRTNVICKLITKYWMLHETDITQTYKVLLSSSPTYVRPSLHPQRYLRHLLTLVDSTRNVQQLPRGPRARFGLFAPGRL